MNAEASERSLSLSPDERAVRVSTDGKFFRLNGKKFYVKGLTYGPFAPNEHNEMFPSRAQTARDLAQISELGANLLRVYHVPPRWFLDLAAEQGLKVLIDIPWPKHLCFLDKKQSAHEAREIVRLAVQGGKGHAAVFAYSVVNEVPAEIVRWSGVSAVTEFIDELVDVAKSVDPECLFTFASFPPTEFLQPQNIDFICFNVYLHHRRSFESYLGRLQMLADNKPLVLGEFGIDSMREGEALKCEILGWQIESAFRAGLAGTVIFSYTDDWYKGGQQVEDWSFGLTQRDRRSKESFGVVQKLFRVAPYFPLPHYPRVSVVVASYNGDATLKACLESLMSLRYPDYEVILVDDGSTDSTPQIAKEFANVRYIRQDNHGLSAARDTGIGAATGEIVAFTDSDCRADEDWLYYLVCALDGGFVGVGGHNFLPPEDSFVAAAVMVSPGGPAHVMLTDREAEHIPGCNMAFYKRVLDEIGGFDLIFRKAGDDVDVCWRLQLLGYKIGFSPAGFVWHYRRSTIGAYLKQQSGYGEAEALLMHKHPEYFNFFGGSIWHGRIYTASKSGVTLQRPVIYHGLFGSGFFQKIYRREPALLLMFCTSLEYHVLITLPLLVLSLSWYALLPVALTSLLLSVGVCALAAAQAALPKKKRRPWSRPLVALLFFLQPIVRGWARYHWRLTVHSEPAASKRTLPREQMVELEAEGTVSYWSESGNDRYSFLNQILVRLKANDWQHKTDTGWSAHDVEIYGSHWSRLRLATVTEELGSNKRIFRCRLNAMWSLPACVIFWAVCGAELLVIGLLAPTQPWIWMLLASLSLLGWWLDYERRDLLFGIAALLDEVASQQNLVRLPPSVPGSQQSSTASPEDSGIRSERESPKPASAFNGAGGA